MEVQQVGGVCECALLVPERYHAAALGGHRAKVTGFHSSRLLLVSHTRGTGYGRWYQDPWWGSGRGRLLARDTNTEDTPPRGD